VVYGPFKILKLHPSVCWLLLAFGMAGVFFDYRMQMLKEEVQWQVVCEGALRKQKKSGLWPLQRRGQLRLKRRLK
jgi:hypothetical protein